MPAGKDDDNSAACVQSGAHRGLVLVPQLIAVGGRFSLGAVLDGVIDNKQVCAIAGDGAADTDGDHTAHAVVEVPVRFGGLHLGDGMPKQRRTELLDLIAVPLAELLGKVAAIADLDDTLLWVLSQIERGEGFGHGHGLAVARRHEYHQPLGLPLYDAFQLLAHKVEVSGSFPPAHVNVLDIIGIVPSRQFITKLLTGRGFLSFRIGPFIRSLLHRSCRPEPPSAPPRSGSHKVLPEQNHQA